MTFGYFQQPNTCSSRARVNRNGQKSNNSYLLLANALLAQIHHLGGIVFGDETGTGLNVGPG